MNSVIIIPALGDNFIYLYVCDERSAFVVDPGDSSSVLRTVKKLGLGLTAVLATHHHWDHVAGVVELKKMTGCQVIGGDRQRIPGIDLAVEDGQVVTVGNAKIEVIGTPGHTRTSVCYYVPAAEDSKHGILWTGDALFVGGCGRLLECNAQAMLDSLLKLACLPDQTLVYCGHDYAAEDYEFALGIEPANQAVRERLSEIRQVQSQGKLTVPSTIFKERRTNPFLRAGTSELKAALGMAGAAEVEVFAELRRRKDVF